MTQKSILITGSSSGIGLNAAHGLRAAGWRVFASCRKQEDCTRLQADGFESPLIDYADADTITRGLAEVLVATGGTLDALYNNGAYACPGAVEDVPTAALREIFETNLFGVHELTRQVVPVMRKQGHGRIINCSSVLGIVGYKLRGAYVATKYALEGMSDVLRLELSDAQIKVILIEPGPITSRFRKNAVPHFEKWIDWKSSNMHDAYQAEIGRLYTETEPSTFELQPDAVTKKLVHALTAARPKPRYFVTVPTHFIGIAKRLLSTRALDWLILRN